jgi:hypothetical protein
MNAVAQQMSSILQPIELENAIEERTFEKVLLEKKRIVFEELSVEDIERLPPPPDHF